MSRRSNSWPCFPAQIREQTHIKAYSYFQRLCVKEVSPRLHSSMYPSCSKAQEFQLPPPFCTPESAWMAHVRGTDGLCVSYSTYIPTRSITSRAKTHVSAYICLCLRARPASRTYIREPPHLLMHSMSHHDIDQRNDPCMRRRKTLLRPRRSCHFDVALAKRFLTHVTIRLRERM